MPGSGMDLAILLDHRSHPVLGHEFFFLQGTEGQVVQRSGTDLSVMDPILELVVLVIELFEMLIPFIPNDQELWDDYSACIRRMKK